MQVLAGKSSYERPPLLADDQLIRAKAPDPALMWKLMRLEHEVRYPSSARSKLTSAASCEPNTSPAASGTTMSLSNMHTLHSGQHIARWLSWISLHHC